MTAVVEAAVKATRATLAAARRSGAAPGLYESQDDALRALVATDAPVLCVLPHGGDRRAAQGMDVLLGFRRPAGAGDGAPEGPAAVRVGREEDPAGDVEVIWEEGARIGLLRWPLPDAALYYTATTLRAEGALEPVGVFLPNDQRDAMRREPLTVRVEREGRAVDIRVVEGVPLP